MDHLLPSTKFSCLVCACCDASIAQSTDIVPFPIPAGGLSSSTVFAYELEDLLDLSVGVWCYSCTEHVESSVTLVEPAALQPSPWSGTNDAMRQLTRADRETQIGVPSESAASPELTASNAASSSVRSEATSKRIDLIRIRDTLINASLVLSPSSVRDQASSPPSTAADGEGARTDHGGSYDQDAASSRNEEILFEETHAIFRQTRTHESWFRGFSAKGKLFCAGCDEHLGWLFVPKGRRSSSSSVLLVPQDEEDEQAAPSSSDIAEQEVMDNGGTLMPSITSSHVIANIDETDLAPFCGLLLKKMKQREWNLLEILRPLYASSVKRAASSASAGAGSTDASLVDLTLRVQSLRQQTMLYIDLLTKHKEQGDVQRQLLQSQKDRIGAHEEKISTLQQIADAQRQQLDMQQRHLKYQEELLRNQREQIATQQQQIEVEQMLLGEQNRTIHTQLEQMKVMQAHLRAKDERLRLETEMRRLNDRRQQQQQLAIHAAATDGVAQTHEKCCAVVDLLEKGDDEQCEDK
jgi:hypothetical protein